MSDELVLQVHIAADTDQDGERLARMYWQTVPPTGTQRVAFAHTVTQLAREFDLTFSGALSGRVREVAHATSASIACSTCSAPVQLRVRQQLRDALSPNARAAERLCEECVKERDLARAEYEDRIVQRDLLRSAKALRWFTDAHLESTAADLVSRLSTHALLSAVAMLRSEISRPASLPWVDNADTVVRELNAHRIAEPEHLASLFVWASDDPADEQTFDRWRPNDAHMHLTPDGAAAVDAEIANRRVSLATDQATMQAAREVLLDEMIAIVAFHLADHNLPGLTPTQRDRLIATLSAHPDVTLAQIVNAAWRASRDGAATYQAIKEMTKEKATSHVVNKMAKILDPSLGPYQRPYKYAHGPLTLLIFREILDRDVMDANFDSLPDEELADGISADSDQTPDLRLIWRLATIAAGTDADLSSGARDVVETAADMFTELAAAGLPQDEATLVAYHGTNYLRAHVDEHDLAAARELLSAALTRGGLPA